ncbi:GspH/FimT family pseudopilin [Dyella silvae]|uniref:GspH/FimT family pseudopilin n=1 Tax=Dyella silvae TaxID=2994424 RepID=UPI002264E2C9|nr:GspH/FimT family pseudopilin [Dyella silvae]
MRTQSESGFTLVELMVTVTIVVILTLLAVPSFAPMLNGQRIKNASLDLVSTVTLARSEAIKRNTVVNVSANAAGWNAGWSVAPGTAAAIRSEAALSGITITETNANTQFQFGGNGRMQQPLNVSFTIKPTTAITGVQPVCVKVGATGRAQILTGACS